MTPMDYTLCDTADYTLHDTMDHVIHDTMNHSQHFEHHAITSGLEHPQSLAENIFGPPPLLPHNHASCSFPRITMHDGSMADPAGGRSARQTVSPPQYPQFFPSFAVGNDSRFGRSSDDYRSTSLSLPYPSESCENRQALPSGHAVNIFPLNETEEIPSTSLPTTISPSTDEHPASVYCPHPEYKVYWYLTCWKAVVINGPRKFVEQTIYQPKYEGDKARYVSLARLHLPIVFFPKDSPEWGVPLRYLLSKRGTGLSGWNEPAFTSCGPSVYIRLQWPGYPPYHKQVKTNDYRHECRMINKAKLAQVVAKCIKEFIETMRNQAMQAEVDRRWKVGPQGITVNDIILVSLHHVSRGSWQPQLRLSRIV